MSSADQGTSAVIDKSRVFSARRRGNLFGRWVRQVLEEICRERVSTEMTSRASGILRGETEQ